MINFWNVGDAGEGVKIFSLVIKFERIFLSHFFKKSISKGSGHTVASHIDIDSYFSYPCNHRCYNKKKFCNLLTLNRC